MFYKELIINFLTKITMKNLFTRFLFLAGLIVYLALLGNRSGAPAGRTGAPGEETCATSSCHNGTLNSGSATINLAINEGERAYVLGATHKVSIAIDSPQNAGRNGFEIVALDAQDNNVGEWILAGNDKRERSANGRNYITHTTDGSGQSNWEMDWKAPETDAGVISFYLAVNDANNNGGSTGDNIYATTVALEAEVASSIKTIRSLENIVVYPNPVKARINIKLDLTTETLLTGNLVNTLGQSVGQLFHEQMPSGVVYKSFPTPSQLSVGQYFLEIRNEQGGVKSIPIFKR